MSHKTQTGLDIYFANKSPTACRRSFITLIVQSSHSKANSPSHIEKLTSKSQRSKTSHFSQFEFSLAASYFRRKLQRIMFQGKFHLSVTSSSFTHVLVCWLRFANSSNDHWIHVARIVAMFQHPLLPIFQLGFGFYFILTAFQSCSVIEVAILHSAEAQNSTSHAIDKHAGYYSLTIIYAVLTLCNLFITPVVQKLSAKWSMVIGGVTYSTFLASFLYLRTELLYAASAFLGFVAWVGQGNYLTLASDKATVGKNAAIVWAIFQLSLPTGGLFLYSQFRDGSNELSSDTVRLIFIVFTCMAVVGTALFALLKQMRPEEQLESLLEYESDRESPSVDSVAVTMVKKRLTVIEEIVRTFKLLQSGNMICLVVVFLYSGILLTFWSGVYGTCLTFTRQFTVSTKVLLALNVIFVGLGESLGSGLVFGLIISTIESMGRPVVIILGAVVNVLSFFLIFLYIPSMSPFQPTDDIAYFLPNEYVAILCSFLLGFGDSCWNTQIYATLGSKYTTESTRAFALFKFFNKMSKNLKTIEIDDTDQARGYFYLFDIEETVAERLIGLTEMLPEGMQKAIFTICSTASELGRKLFVFTRSAMWIAASSAMILILPVMFEKDRADFQQMHLQQQNQILFGPGAAAAYSGQAGSSGDHEIRWMSNTKKQVLDLYRYILKVGKQWTNSSNRGNNISDKEAKRYIVEEARRLFKQNKTLTNPIEIEELIREGRTRIAIAVHYGNPYPRPVYAFPKTLPIREVSNQQTEKQSTSMNHRMATNNQIPSTS
ncbi:UNC93-like protein MFSD11 [Trichinella spiralis]|uniref:UNC93-like protein MFSD11 n=1 Tax=Trichinella spiralis TaxID=6334 RepID=A0A0V1AR81_TRISP|nr:UNC93-like protein MFSD11 [Trichinella spiralis]